MAKGKAEIAKARAGLTQERLRLKEDRLALEREWGRLQRTQDAMTRERTDAIAYLRRLCERYGDNDWTDQMPLADILEYHLAEPLADGIARIRRRMDGLQRALREAETLPSIRPVALPPYEAVRAAPDQPISRVEVVGGARQMASYRAICSCSWMGMVRSADHAAEADRSGHARTHRLRREAI